MYYYLDGYNLLFTVFESRKPIPSQRESLILFLQKMFSRHHFKGMLVFDGAIRLGEESGKLYPSPLEVVYTSKGQTADAYILEQIEIAKTPQQTIVVSCDQGLCRNARTLKAKTMDNHSFLQKLEQRKAASAAKPVFSETKKNIERLLKIFEDKLKNEEID